MCHETVHLLNQILKTESEIKKKNGLALFNGDIMTRNILIKEEQKETPGYMN